MMLLSSFWLQNISQLRDDLDWRENQNRSRKNIFLTELIGFSIVATISLSLLAILCL